MEISKNVKVLENKMNENVRNYSFDVLRILACFGVIFNHTVVTRTFKYLGVPQQDIYNIIKSMKCERYKNEKEQIKAGKTKAGLTLSKV